MDRQHCTEVETEGKEVERVCLVGWGRWESNSARENEQAFQESEVPLCSGDWHEYYGSHNFLPRNPALPQADSSEKLKFPGGLQNGAVST